MEENKPIEPEQPPLKFISTESETTTAALSKVVGNIDHNIFYNIDDNQEIFLPVHDFPRYTADEISIINHPAFQRLRKVYQLGQAHLVFPGATHKRFEHSLGTVWVAQKMIDAINDNFRRSRDDRHHEESECEHGYITEREARFVRLAALLHDIGHVPAGHTLEDELCILPKHDGEKRLKDVLGKTDWIDGLVSERLEDVIDRLYKPHLPNGSNSSPVAIFLLLVSKESESDQTNLIDEIKVKVCRDIVGNTICADLLDYLYRDWHHIGKPRYFDTRFFQYMQIRRERTTSLSHLVISVGTPQRPRYDAITSILHLLEIRYELAEAVIFHPTKCSAAAMLERALGELSGDVPTKHQEKWKKSLNDKLLSCSDDSFLDAMLKDAVTYSSEAAIKLLQHLMGRSLYKGLLTVSAKDITTSSEVKIVQTYTGLNPREEKVDPNNARLAATKRLGELRKFESQLGLPLGSVVMYCPQPQMNSKIAKVKIILDDVIKTLSEWDEGSEHIAGEHTKAQLARFQRLWRVQIYVSPAVRADLVKDRDNGGENTFLLETAARLFLLGNTQPGRSLNHESLRWAQNMTTQVTGFVTSSQPLFQGKKAKKLREIQALAAKGGMPDKYLMGAYGIPNLFST